MRPFYDSEGGNAGNWQRFLSHLGFLGANGIALTVDENWGGNTSFATRAYQHSVQLPQSGQLDDVTKAQGILDGFIPFIQARCFNPMGVQRRVVTSIIVHIMEAPTKPTTALNVANWFASRTDPAMQASAHYCIDEAESIQCVRDNDVAWACGVDNPHTVSIEHAGYAKETDADWSSPSNLAMLKRSAIVAAGICREYNIEPVRLSDDGIKAGARGFAGHVDVNRALANGHGHVDPGEHFPWNEYLALISEALDDAPVITPGITG